MRASLCVLLLILNVLPVQAEDVFVSSMRLRGGYDSNPLLTPDGKGGAFATLEGAFAGGRSKDGWITGVTGEFSATKFSEPEFRTFQNHRFRLRLSNEDVQGVALDSTTMFAAASTYDTRVSQIVQRSHVQYAKGRIRPFAALETRLISLNEINPLLGGFLPEPMKFLRGTIEPGIAYGEGGNEITASVVVGRTKYEGSADLFGFRRDNNRVQPRLSVKTEQGDLSWQASVSYFRAISEDSYFTDVSHFLFDIAGTAKFGNMSADVSFAQTAEETTFPVSPMTINRLFQAKLTWTPDDKASFSVFTRQLRRDYWDTPLYSRLRAYGVEANYNLNADVALSGELAFTRAMLLSGAEAEGLVATLGLTRRFGNNAKK